MPQGSVSFHRQAMEEDEFPEWYKSTAQLPKLKIHPHGTIEDNGLGMLQVDFANSFIGGGVLAKVT